MRFYEEGLLASGGLHLTRAGKTVFAHSMIWKCVSCTSVIFNIIFIIVIAVLAGKKVEQPILDSPCPPRWLHYEGICYFFSTAERNQSFSQGFCSSYNASLATIEGEEKDFVMQYRKSKEPYWIGLTRESGQSWKWLNGDNATLEVLGDGGNCAYLNDEAEAKASASRCSTEHCWICSRKSK